MTNQEKRQLFEDIMRELAPLVKTNIERYCASNNDVMFYKEQKRLDNILKKIYARFNENVENLTEEEIKEMCVDYLDRYQTCSSLCPKSTVEDIFGNYRGGERLNEVFNKIEDFEMSFDDIKSTLTRTFGMREAYVELFDPTNHGTLAFIKQPVDRTVGDNYIISTIVPVINKNLNVLVDFMDANGYYLIRCMLGNDVIRYGTNEQTFMANLCFARKVPVDISGFVKMKKYLFHVTPDSNMKTIGAQGLVPR